MIKKLILRDQDEILLALGPQDRKLRALEKEFKIDTRGYRLKEVDQYLDLIIQDYETFIKIIEQLSKENQKLNDEILKLKQDLRDASIQTEIAKASPGNTNNLDVLKRLSNLEKVIYGSEKEDKE